MKLIFFLFSFVIFTLNLNSQHRQEIHCKHWIYGYPYGTPPTNDLIIRDIYALSSNDSTKFADWVAYILTRESISGKNKTREWASDPWLEENETLEPNDYEGANKVLKADRGHQAPLANFSNSPDYYQTNYLSNITPQSADLNQGAWKNLEEFERKLVLIYDTIYVITGPVYEKYIGTLPNADEKHKIPSGYWKIIIINKNQNLITLAFKMDQNTPRKYDFTKSVTSIDSIEKLTGLDFLWELNDKIEGTIESKTNANILEKINKELLKLKN